LLDDSLKINGVLFAGVPGAGGYDAIFCIIADDGDDVYSTFHQLHTLWESRDVRVCPLLAREESSGIMFDDVEELNPCIYA
jgi:phosphomevalonate kinase